MAAGVVIIGAGIGGLSAAAVLAARGVPVTLLEKEAAPGGKARQVAVDGRLIDGGPTVLTLQRHLAAVFTAAGARMQDHVTLTPAQILARHAWTDGGRLDLHADPGRSADAIAAFAGAGEAAGFRRFITDAARVFRTLDRSFMQADRPGMARLIASAGPFGLPDLLAIRPFTSLWAALGGYFKDPRLRQLFGRYATYCGSSPFLSPATLMLVAHAEQEGVWQVQGGMHRVAAALADLATERGAEIRYCSPVRRIRITGGRATGVDLADGSALDADAVLVNADVAALAGGLLGPEAGRAVARPGGTGNRSLSAVTWCLAARTAGFPLSHHTVFFSDDYPAEFTDILVHRRLPRQPTVYVCAQDRTFGPEQRVVDGVERLLVLVNAPADGDGDSPALAQGEIAACAERTFGLLARCGLTVQGAPGQKAPGPESLGEGAPVVVTTPRDFHRLFPGTGGALYGRASHGWQASFQRPGVVGRIPGLYLAGGSAHPGPGVPMAALSGRMAAERIIRDRC
ncbi:MAG: methoxyneurosporene dehydrogenase [Pseudomonadota bacterium]|jgi:1-hydroxycarotenoid 3,4-desaturase